MLAARKTVAADGSYGLPGYSAKQFSAAGKKASAYACTYAFVRSLVWLTMRELEFEGEGQDRDGSYVMG